MNTHGPKLAAEAFIESGSLNWASIRNMSPADRAAYFRNEKLWNERGVDIWFVDNWSDVLRTHLMDRSEDIEKSEKSLQEAGQRMSKTIRDIAGSMKNDVVSISASSDKMAREMYKVHQSTKDVIGALTGESMVQAINNAERLATALKAISELQSHSITFAVLDKKPQA